MRLYLDANAIVFAVEGPEFLRSFVGEWTSRAEGTAHGAVLTSRLSIAEGLARPLRDRDSSRIEQMRAFFRTRVEITSVDDSLVDLAVDLHREFSLKTIDALHVASAIRARADVLLTRDAGISRYKSFRGVACEAILAGR